MTSFRRIGATAAALLLLGPATASAISGGEVVAPGTYPAVGVLRGEALPSSLRCTGTLVAPQWVLAAGHCDIMAPGTFTLNPATPDGAGGERHQVDRTSLAPGYQSFQGDASLLHLTTPATVTPLQVAGPAERDLWQPGTKAVFLGYGAINSTFTPPPGLKRAPVTILTDADCTKAYPRFSLKVRVFAADRDVCVSTGSAGGGAGDSGGPLLVTAPDGRVRIAGTVSGLGLAGPGPLVFGRVGGDYLRPWLTAQVPRAIGSPPSPPTPTKASKQPKQKTVKTTRGSGAGSRPSRPSRRPSAAAPSRTRPSAGT